LFLGPPGLGKTTMANIISKELGVNIISISGPVLMKPRDLAGVLTKLKKFDVLFIDEIHRINKQVEEYLYQAMEDYRIDLIIDSGPQARALKLNLQPFTLIGATTRSGLLTSALRSRFGYTPRIDYYETKDLKKIIQRSARILNIEIDDEGAEEIARRSRGTPRIANRLLRRIRDFAEVKGKGKITKEITRYGLEMLEVDEEGLDPLDKLILKTIIEKFKGGPVGLNTLATAIGEDAETIEEVFEPYLIMRGFLERTSRGRVATELAYKHLKYPVKTKTLF